MDDGEHDDLDAVIDRALRRASLPASNEAQSWVAVRQTDAPAPAPAFQPPVFDDGD